METINTVSSEIQNNYAGFERRFLAYWVDFLILFLIGLVIQQMLGMNPFAVFQAQTAEQLQQMQQSSAGSLSNILNLALVIAFYLIMWVNFDGATPGKKLMAIKIVKADASKVTYPIAFIRYIGYFLSTFIFCLGYFWIIWDKKKQGWHDKIAGTVVIKTDSQPKTFLAVVLTLIAIVGISGYMGAAMVKGFMLGIRLSESIRNSQGGVITNLANEGQPLAQLPANELAANIFLQVNEKRAQNNLTAFKEDQQLCAYTQRRLDQLAALGKQDDGRGFYEDAANPQINRAYFSEYLNMGTILFNLSPVIATSPQEVVDSWVNVSDSSAMSPTYNSACVRANSQFVVLVAGQHK